MPLFDVNRTLFVSSYGSCSIVFLFFDCQLILVPRLIWLDRCKRKEINSLNNPYSRNSELLFRNYRLFIVLHSPSTTGSHSARRWKKPHGIIVSSKRGCTSSRTNSVLAAFDNGTTVFERYLALFCWMYHKPRKQSPKMAKAKNFQLSNRISLTLSAQMG